MSPLLRGITSNHVEDFYCLNCFHSFSTKNKLKKHENVCKNHGYCYIEMPKEDNKILKHNHGETSLKLPFIFMLTWSLCLIKCKLAIIILKSHQQIK